MKKKIAGPFKRNKSKKVPDDSIRIPFTSILLVAIVITQLPLALKASLDVVCIARQGHTHDSNISWCKYI